MAEVQLYESRRVRSSVIPLIAASILAACNGGADATAPKRSTVEKIILSQTAVTLEEGLSTELSATLKTASDSVLTGIPVTWQSDNPGVASVSAGIIVGIAVGSARITATAGGKTAAATVSIIAPLFSSIELSRYKAFLAPGRTLELTADALDSRGRVLSRPIAFASSNTAVAEVTAAGVVTAKAVGAATIIASSEGKQSALNLTVALPTAVSFVVQATVPSGFLQLGSFSIRARHADDSVSANIPFGAPATLAGSMVLADAIEFVADANDGSTWPSTATALRSVMPSTIPIVFIPRNITLTSGGYAGTTVNVNVMSATAPCSVVGDQCRNGFYGTSFSTGVKRWPSYPIPVKMDAAFSSTPVWDALRAMEASVGKKMFVVADESDMNYIEVRSGLPPGISGFTGYTTWSWDAQNRMTAATVWLTTTSSRSLIQHEFLHALGFWHTCAWTTVMGGYGCPQAAEISSTDVGYLLLASAVYEAEASLRLPNGQLPCITMSLFATIPNKSTSVGCFENELRLPDSFVRQESAP